MGRVGLVVSERVSSCLDALIILAVEISLHVFIDENGTRLLSFGSLEPSAVMVERFVENSVHDDFQA